MFVPSNNQPPSFPSTQPRPPEASLKGCGCVPLNNHANKNTGLPGISTAKKHIFGRWQITGKPCIQAVFQALICFLHSASIPRTQREVFRLFHTFQKCSKNAVFMLV